jgi:hypothetical protein
LISEQLLAAWMATEYRIFIGAETLVMRIDHRNADLGGLLDAAGVESAAFVTAWNPRSTVVSDEANGRAQEALIGKLETAGLGWWPGAGIDPASGHAEDSFLILGIGAEEAEALAGAFGQDAIVLVGRDCVPKLRVIRHE